MSTNTLTSLILSETEFREAARAAVQARIGDTAHREPRNAFSVFTNGLAAPLIYDDKYSAQRMADCLRYEIPSWYYNVAHPYGSHHTGTWEKDHRRYTAFSNTWRKNTKLRRAVLQEMQEERLLFFGRSMKVLDPSWTPNPDSPIRL